MYVCVRESSWTQTTGCVQIMIYSTFFAIQGCEGSTIGSSTGGEVRESEKLNEYLHETEPPSPKSNFVSTCHG